MSLQEHIERMANIQRQHSLAVDKAISEHMLWSPVMEKGRLDVSMNVVYDRILLKDGRVIEVITDIEDGQTRIVPRKAAV